MHIASRLTSPLNQSRSHKLTTLNPNEPALAQFDPMKANSMDGKLAKGSGNIVQQKW